MGQGFVVPDYFYFFSFLFFLSNFYLRSEQDGETLKRQHRAASKAALVGGERIVRKLRVNERVRER